MKKDFELISHKLGENLPYVNIYPLGDLHIGSDHFNLDIWTRWKQMVLDDPYGRVVMIGDMMDNGLKNSKTNAYEATMRPFEQKQWLTRELRPLADKILGATQGNHEYRSNILTDDCPLYDVMAKLDLEDLYRENMAFIKVNLGRKSSERQWSYSLVLAHGNSRNKTEKFSYSIDGMDILVTGHIHDASAKFPSKIVIDTKNEIVKLVGYVHIVVPSFQTFGGYALRGMYMPTDSNKFPVIRLSGEKKEVSMLWI